MINSQHEQKYCYGYQKDCYSVCHLSNYLANYNDTVHIFRKGKHPVSVPR